MDRLEFCKMSHEHKDKLMYKMQEAVGDKSIEITMTDMVTYLTLRAICKDNMHEITREQVWEPVNAKMREADGLTEPKYMTEHKRATYSHNEHDHDVDKEISRVIDMGHVEGMEKLSAVLSEHFASLAVMNPTMYQNVLTDLKSIRY